MKPEIKRAILTHSLIIVGFFIVNLLVNYPAIVSDKSLNQHDILQSIGSNHQLAEYRNATGEEPLWNPYLFSGMPAYLTGMMFSGDLLKYVYRVMLLGLGHPSGILFIAFVSFYILLLSFKVRPLLACAGALAFGLNGFNVIGIMAGHNAKIAAVALMPLALAGVHLTMRGKRWLGFGLTALGLGLQIRANHPQITYYLIFIVLAYGINELVISIQNKEIKPLLTKGSLLLLAAVLAAGANFGSLATTLEYSKYTIRGKSELSQSGETSGGLDKEYAFRYSNGITEPLFLLVPNIFGGSSQQELSEKSEVAKALRNAGYNRTQIANQVKAMPTYWGDQPLTAPYFAGTLSVLLFVLGIVYLKKKEKIWLVTLVILGIVLSWGKNFESLNYFLFDTLPGYNKFRSVTFTIIISIFALNLLGFLALDRFLEEGWTEKTKKAAYLSIGIVGGFLLALVVFAGAFGFRGAIDAQLPDWLTEAIRQDRKSLLRKDALRALMFITAFVTLIWSVAKQRAKTLHVVAGIAVLVFVDNFSLTKRFLGEEKFMERPVADFTEKTPADQVLSQSLQPGERVLNLQNPFNENRTSYYHASIGGYHGAKIRRYQDLIDYCLQAELQFAIEKLRSQSADFSDLPVLNMLNTGYFYAGEQAGTVFPNRYANGAAWVVNDLVGVSSPDEEISSTCSLDSKRIAVIDQSKFSLPETVGSGSISLLDKKPDEIVYQASIDGGAATGIFSEIYYDAGWKAYIDDNPVDILRANFVLRALEIPAGDHTITFKFEPKTYYTGNTITFVCSSIVILLFLGGVFIEIRKGILQQAPISHDL